VIMEPLLGGKLATPPAPIQDLWSQAQNNRTPVEWALSWLWNKPQVSITLSGMSAMEHVQQNVEFAERSAVGMLTDQELELIAKVREKYDELCPIPCTQCRYCMPCPNGVDIPRNFATFNDGVMYNAFGEARRRYSHMDPDIQASACIECGTCEDLCPQNIPIRQWMPLVDAVLGEGKPYEECALPG
jgi:predicted aldo/keto reductase-like oxidoreductase